VCNEFYDNIMDVVIGILGCISVLEKPGQNLDMHAPPDDTRTTARRLVGLACYVILYEICILSYLNDDGDTYICAHFSRFHHEPPGGRGMTCQATYTAQPSFGCFDIFGVFCDVAMIIYMHEREFYVVNVCR